MGRCIIFLDELAVEIGYYYNVRLRSNPGFGHLSFA